MVLKIRPIRRNKLQSAKSSENHQTVKNVAEQNLSPDDIFEISTLQKIHTYDFRNVLLDKLLVCDFL